MFAPMIVQGFAGGLDTLPGRPADFGSATVSPLACEYVYTEPTVVVLME